MDAVFCLDVEARSHFVKTLAQSIGCSYMCLWSYVPLLPDRLFSIDGWYKEESSSSSSSGSFTQTLFNAYRQTLHSIDNGFVPGLAFKEGIPYLELHELELRRRTSNEYQRRFYQEARIKVNMKMEINNWFQQFQSKELPLPPDQDKPSSSSSSLRSLSVGSPESSPLFLNMPSTSYTPEFIKGVQIEQPIRPTSTAMLPHQLPAMEVYNPLRTQYLNPESDNAAMARAMLAVMSSPSSSSSSYSQPIQTNIYNSHNASPKTGAFKEYTSSLGPNIPTKVNSGKQNMIKRAISIMRNIDLGWRQELAQGIPHQSSSQLHHKLSERKRREKLNESFQELRSLLPPGSKKDKASVLSSTLDYLSGLKNEVLELKKKNNLLEARALHAVGASEEAVTGSLNENFDVQIIQVSESTSQEQEIDLRVTIRGNCNIVDLIIDILEFLKLMKEVSLVFMNADAAGIQTSSTNRIILRLKLKESEWDRPAFQEAMTRIVADATI
ncbi:hypothetical protein IFM89_038219 [Coptis chinensis]|uniref:BHLH domain-containing protein n=1 Tax=Coptis chinensis TaxID=261450 RepID=A0A835III6_9MAGN|nr:hypothetical protein IFM89_038219 [Coptis chinensis]